MKMRACCLIATLTVAAAAMAEVVVQPGDLAIGMNTNSGSTTADQVRGGSRNGSWTKTAFLQAMEFDNAGGIQHNAAGNLLALNFGTSGAGGSMANLSTDGSDNAQSTMFKFDGASFGLTKSRVSGLSVSPDNKYVAVYGTDLGGIQVLEYDAGTTIGTGAGASITNGWQVVLGTTLTTQGTTWYDNDTILATIVEADVISLYTIDFDGSGGFTTTKVRELTTGTSGTRVTDVDYNTAVAPYVFASYSVFVNSVTTNKIAIIDPSDWSIVKTLDVSKSMNTLREIALGPALELYAGQFAGSGARPHVDVLKLDAAFPLGVINGDDIAALTDDSTSDYYSGSVNASFSGIDVAFGQAATSGACCFGEESCFNLSSDECSAQGGTYKGDGTECSDTICLPPTGACCVALEGCDITTQKDCESRGGEYKGDLTVCDCNSCSYGAVAVEAGDVAFGLSVADPNVTTDQIRGGVKIGQFPGLGFAQSMEFDNTDGVWHNAHGNLLCLNFGSGNAGGGPDCSLPPETDQGGKLYNYATDGSGAAEIIYEFDTRKGGIACTRVGGLSVSPDNKYVAMLGYDTGSLYVLEYAAGATPGAGSGASITRAWEYTGDGRDTFTSARYTQGTTWLNDRTILANSVDVNGVPGVSNLYAVQFDPDAGTFSETLAKVLFNVGAGSRYTDVEYNPNVAPYIFCSFSSFDSGVTSNSLTILDLEYNEKTYLEFNVIDPVKKLETMREIALSPDKRLYIAQFSTMIDTLTLDVDGNGTIDDSDIGSLVNDSTEDYFTSCTFAAFSGMDIAFEGEAHNPCDGIARGDSDGSGAVDFNDIDCFVAALISFDDWQTCGGSLSGEAAYICANDTDKSGGVDFNDIDTFVQCIIDGGCE